MRPIGYQRIDSEWSREAYLLSDGTVWWSIRSRTHALLNVLAVEFAPMVDWTGMTDEQIASDPRAQ